MYFVVCLQAYSMFCFGYLKTEFSASFMHQCEIFSQIRLHVPTNSFTEQFVRFVRNSNDIRLKSYYFLNQKATLNNIVSDIHLKETSLKLFNHLETAASIPFHHDLDNIGLHILCLKENAMATEIPLIICIIINGLQLNKTTIEIIIRILNIIIHSYRQSDDSLLHISKETPINCNCTITNIF